MARIEDLIDEISDPALRDQIAREVKELKSAKRFGLVYEDHVPETVSLFGLPVRPGSIVQKRTEPNDQGRYEVTAVDGDTASIVPVGVEEPVEQYPVRDLLTVKRFEEPIYPGLTPVGEVRRGPEEKPAHTVINGENYHALQLLAYTHAGKVDVIYIDPPYNTGDKSWKYNNRFVDSNDSYRHSKWLAMMEKRLKLAEKLLKPDGVLVVAIDENELFHLGVMLEGLFADRETTPVAVVHNPRGIQGDNFSYTNDYALFSIPRGAKVLSRIPRLDGSTQNLRNWGGESERTETGTTFYPVFVRDGEVVGFGEVLPWGEHPDGTVVERDDGVTEVWPIDDEGVERKWRYSRDSVEGIRQFLRYEAHRGPGQRIQMLKDSDQYKTVWVDPKFDANAHGTQLLDAFIPDRFPYPKSLNVMVEVLLAGVRHRPNAVTLDFFAGSGTTLHATAMLNAQDGGNRQCILVTNNDVSDSEQKALNKAGLFVGDAEYEAQGIFESITRPRVEAAITGVRPDGKPVEGSYLEQYLPEHDYTDGFKENVAFFRMDYLEPDLVELGRQYEAIAPLLWMTAGSVGYWEPWDGEAAWSAPEDSTYAVLFDESEAAAFGAYVESRSEEITHAWIVTDSHSAYLDLQEQLPSGIDVGQLYRDYLRNFVVNAPGVVR